MNELTNLSMRRRRFLQAALITGSAAMLPDWLRFGEAAAATPLGATDGILVLLQLSGGNDGLNTVVPVDAGRYRDLRKGLAITRAGGALDIGGGLALHPSLPNLKRRWDSGQVAIVQGVGYTDPNLSHFDSMGTWMTGWGGSGKPSSGWLGRWLDGLPNADSLRLVEIGGNVPPHLRGNARSGLSLPTDFANAFGTERVEGWQARLLDSAASFASSASDRGPLATQLGQLTKVTIDLAGQVAPAYNGLQSEGLTREMMLAARLINANVGVRVFSLELGGFDTHEQQAGDHAELLTKMDAAIEAFYATLDPSWRSRVTLMTFSEFGRRPEANGSAGTDHGTAAPMFVIGNSVKGGLYGNAPSLTSFDAHGNLVATSDFRQLYATILNGWLAAPPEPILGKSYSTFDLFIAGPAGSAKDQGATAAVTGSWGGAGGYWTVSDNGTVNSFGSVPSFGDAPAGVSVASIAPTVARDGYWLVTSNGTVLPYGTAVHYGDMKGKPLSAPIVDLAATPTGKGYWLLGRDGGVFSFGDAQFYGSTGAMKLSKPVVGMAATPSGRGYWFVAEDGGVFAFGPDAQFYGSTGAMRLTKPVVAMAPTPTGKGYWLVARDGGVFAFGDAQFYGSTGGITLNRPVVGIAPTPGGKGYWFVAEDGGVFAFGDAAFLGSSVGATSGTVVAMA